MIRTALLIAIATLAIAHPATADTIRWKNDAPEWTGVEVIGVWLDGSGAMRVTCVASTASCPLAKSGMHTGARSIIIDRHPAPADAQTSSPKAKPAATPAPSRDWRALAPGDQFTLAKSVPLMPALDPADPFAALDKIRRLRPGTRLTVRAVADKNGNPWYHVALGPDRSPIGWINSTALLDQDHDDK